MERKLTLLREEYFPSSTDATLVFGNVAFSYETAEQTAWREASNRMKRMGDLWALHASQNENLWDKWCTARGATDATAR